MIVWWSFYKDSTNLSVWFCFHKESNKHLNVWFCLCKELSTLSISFCLCKSRIIYVLNFVCARSQATWLLGLFLCKESINLTYWFIFVTWIKQSGRKELNSLTTWFYLCKESSSLTIWILFPQRNQSLSLFSFFWQGFNKSDF